ncbi:MAG: hypothetical protein ABIJ59_16175 [Pseudomonadota bacterium]
MTSCKCTDIDEYRGILGKGGGEYSLGQSTWQYKNGKVIIYGADESQIYYILFSEVPLTSFSGADYPPKTPSIESGGFEFQKNNKKEFFPFTKKTLILIIRNDKSLKSHQIEISMDEFRAIMQPYANSSDDKDYDKIIEIYKNKING